MTYDFQLKKHLITILAIIAILLLCGHVSAQTKTVKPDTALIVLYRADAPMVLDKLKLAYNAVEVSDVISANQALDTKNVLLYLIQSIYRKWPELAPKEGKK